MNLEDFDEITIEVPWGHIAGRWYGDRQRRPIVAVHGLLDNCGTFARLAPLLASKFGLLCIDWPGHGYSSFLPNGILYFQQDLILILLRVMNAYKWNKISLLGHSMGSLTAINFASLYPDRVDLLISLDYIISACREPKSVINVLNQTFEGAIIENERRMKSTALDEPPSYTYSECVERQYQGSKRSVNRENCKYILDRNTKKSLKFPDKYYYSRDARLKFLRQNYQSKELFEHMIMRICRYQIPYLHIRGNNSHFLDESIFFSLAMPIIKMLEKFNKNFEFHVIEGGTHHLHLNNPREVADLIIKFCKRIVWRNYSNDNCTTADDVAIKFKKVIQSKL